MTRRQWITLAACVLAILILAAVWYAQPADAQSRVRFGEVIVQKLTVLSGGQTVAGSMTIADLTTSGAVTAGSTLDVTGAATVGGALDVTGATTLSDALDVTGAITGSSTIDITGAATAGSTLDVTGDTTLGADLTLTGQTAITITQSGSLTPTGSYQPIQAGGAVSFATIAAGTSGDLLLLENISANTITITDTGTTMLSGNAALGQYDTILLVNDGTNWVEVAQTDN